jgi:hypothetical protein
MVQPEMSYFVAGVPLELKDLRNRGRIRQLTPEQLHYEQDLAACPGLA